MKRSAILSSLGEFQSILKAALQACDNTKSAVVRGQAQDHLWACNGIDEIIHLIKHSGEFCSTSCCSNALPEQHLDEARVALTNVRNACSEYNSSLREARQRLRQRSRHQIARAVIEGLAIIVKAINATILLVPMTASSPQVKLKLESLVRCYQHSHSHPHSRTNQSSVIESHVRPSPSPPTSRCNEHREDALSSTTSILQAELHQAHLHGGFSNIGQAQPPSKAQLLSVNLLGWLLKESPSHPAGVIPELVAYRSDIIVAARTGDHVRLASVLAEKPHAHYSFTIDNLTPIAFAVESGSFETVKCLLDHGVNVNDTYGRTELVPLATALQFRHLDIAQLLVHHGASYSHRSTNGWSLLFYLWQNKHHESSAEPFLGLLSARKDFDSLHHNVYDQDGWPVMHRVAANGTLGDIATLVKLHVNPFVFTKFKESERVYTQCKNYSVLQFAVIKGLFHLVRLLLPLYRGAYGGIDLPDEEGWTLLHLATEGRHLDVVRLLIQEGADINAKTQPTLSGTGNDSKAYSYTPRMLAKEGGNGFFSQFGKIVQGHRQTQSDLRIQTPKMTQKGVSSVCSSRFDRKRPHTQSGKLLQLRPPFGKRPFEQRIDSRKSFGTTNISGRTQAHLGDRIHYYCNTYNISRPSYVAKRRQKRKKECKQDTSKRELRSELRSSILKQQNLCRT